MDHDLLQVGSPRAVAFRESFRVNLFEGFIVVLHALVERGQMRLSGTADRTGFGHGFRVLLFLPYHYTTCYSPPPGSKLLPASSDSLPRG